MKKYMIYGAGAMGTILGAYLSRAGVDILLVSRNEDHVKALCSNGARVIGKDDFVCPVRAATPDNIDGKYDCIFLMTKQRGNERLPSELLKYLTPDGVICTMQNGLPEFNVAEQIGKDKTFGCAVAWGATFEKSGVSRLTSERRSFALGTLGGDREKLGEIGETLSLAGEVKLEENLLGARMAKLTVNAAFSGLSAATGETFGYIYSHSKTNKIALKIINECFAAAKAAGIKIEPIQGHDIEKVLTLGSPVKNFIAAKALKIAMRKHKDLKSGMLKDLKEGRKCDVDYINGAVSSLGKKYGVLTPYNDETARIVHGVENGFNELTPLNVELFEI